MPKELLLQMYACANRWAATVANKEVPGAFRLDLNFDSDFSGSQPLTGELLRSGGEGPPPGERTGKECGKSQAGATFALIGFQHGRFLKGVVFMALICQLLKQARSLNAARGSRPLPDNKRISRSAQGFLQAPAIKPLFTLHFYFLRSIFSFLPVP